MADTKLSALAAATPALGDLAYIVDVSDATDDVAGSSRKTTLQSAFDALGVPYSRGGASITENSDGSVQITSVGVLHIDGGNVGVFLGSATPLASFDVAGTIRAGGGGVFLWRNLTDFSARRNWAWQSESQATGDVCLIESTANNTAPSVPRFQVQSGGAVVVLGPYIDLQSAAWVRGHPGRKRLSADATNATNTLSSGVLSDLTVTLVAGRKYTGRVVLVASNSTGAEGLQFDFNGGTATMTNFQATAEATPIGATPGTTNSTALGTALTDTAVSTTDAVYAVNVTLVCNAGGTFIPRFAENSAHASGTATVKLGSYLWLEDTP